MTKLFFGLVLGLSAFTATADTVCSNGDLGDNFYQITLLEDGIEFAPYESNFTVDVGVIDYKDGVFTIQNQMVSIESEGDPQDPQLLNAMLIYDEGAKTLKASISLAKEAFQTYEMVCKEN